MPDASGAFPIPQWLKAWAVLGGRGRVWLGHRESQVVAGGRHLGWGLQWGDRTVNLSLPSRPTKGYARFLLCILPLVGSETSFFLAHRIYQIRQVSKTCHQANEPWLSLSAEWKEPYYFLVSRLAMTFLPWRGGNV